MNGKLIVLEGQDGVGKQTQTTLLIEALQKKGLTVKTWSFPNYDSPWGKLIRQYLDGALPLSFDSGYTGLLYAADRGLVAADIKQALSEGNWVVCDRYVSSNEAFQGVRIADMDERNAYGEWLEDLEYSHFNLPRPDLTVLLTLPAELTKKRTDERRATSSSNEGKIGKADIHEQNTEFMERVVAEYLRLAEKYQWSQIDCSSQTGEQLSREDIHSKVIAVIEKNFSL